MLKRKKIYRLLSLLVVVALVLASFPAKEVRADESSQDVFIITSFEKQDKQITEKDSFVKGTKVADMGFPAEWDVKGYIQSDETKTLVDKTLKELTWRGKLKDSKSEDMDFYTAESPEGEYVFEPKLPENVKTEDEVKLPARTIKITAAAEEANKEVTADNPKPETPKANPEEENKEVTADNPKPETPKANPEEENKEVTTDNPKPETPETDPEEEEQDETADTLKPEPPETDPEEEEQDETADTPKPEPQKADPEENDQKEDEDTTQPDTNPKGNDEESDTHTVELVIKENLPERIVKGAVYEIKAEVKAAENNETPELRYEIPKEYQSIVQIDKDGKLTVTGTGLFKVNIYCEGVEEALQTIERTAQMPETNAAIKSFVIGEWEGEIEHGAVDGKGHILITVPYETDVTNMIPKITLSGTYAQITPQSETVQNFNRIVVYTVTAEDGTQKAYDVEVKAVCTHDWAPATCTEPETCRICKETRGTALGHKWNPADCTTPETCSICKQTKGEALGHNWIAADCTTPETCSRCKETRGSALGHSWGSWEVVKKPTTTEGGQERRTCSRCKATETRDTSRLNIISKPENNKITGIKEKGIYRVDQLITITAQGAGMDIKDPIANDVRYLPIGWKVTSYYKLTQSPYQVSFSVKSEGDYQLQVYFQKQVYDGKNWISQKETDVRKVNFTISNSKVTPVKTGDETPYEMFALLGAAALMLMAAGGVWMIRRRKI